MPQHADEELRRAALAAAHELATKEPERWKASWDELGEVMGTLFGVLNLMYAFAAPRYLARGNPDKRPTPEQLLGLFNKYIALLDSWKRTTTDIHDHEFLRTEDATRRLRALLETWEFSLEAPAPIVQAARDWLAAYGEHEPAEGWDQWVGPEEDERPGPKE
ncbi:hypothetical protein [Sorangium sp. So ce362]|uniref:hypothetical protein n=1 Tax=Sorangium sp. So ce362 TaxID=3133303 RepID=UPI003F5F665B